jgi:hypothetical protein
MSRTVLFFGLLYLYLWLVVQPCLIYSCGTITNFPIFYKGWPFFLDLVSRPGGLVQYASALLSQLFYYSWAGAVVITLQAWAVTACTGWLLRAVAVPGARLLRFVPALLILAVYGQYAYYLPLIMGALVSLFGACVYVACDKITDSGRSGNPQSTIHNPQLKSLAAFVVLGAVVYVAGAAAFLPFAAVCATYELLYRRWYGVGFVYLLLGAAVPYVAGVLVYRVSILDAYTDLLPLSWRIRGWPGREKMVIAVYVLYLLPPAGVLIGGLWQMIAGRGSAQEADAKAAGKQSAKGAGILSSLRRWRGASAVTWAAGSLVILAAGRAVAVLCLDREEQARLEVHYYACRQMWPQVLQAAWRAPTDPFVMNAVDRALWHTGRFTQDMFSYPQHPNSLLHTADDRVLVYWNKFDTQIDLGLVDIAEKHLTECMETFGEQPMILQRLALVNMVKGSTDTARIYLGALSKTLFYSRWAKDYLARLEMDPNLAEDRQIQELRARRLKKDDTALFYVREPVLAALATQDNRNRMAFEYLMAWYMQTKQLDKFVQNIGRLREFGYTTVPPPYQEALAIYAYPRNKADEYPISPEVRSRFESFSRIFNKYRRDKAAALGELAAGYRSSYLFYYIYAF